MKRRFFSRWLAGVLGLVVVCGGVMAAEPMRTMRYAPGTRNDAETWQQTVRAKLFSLLHLSDLAGKPAEISLDAVLGGVEKREGYTLQEMTLRSTPGRMMKAMLAKPETMASTAPAVVCIHGHGGNRNTPFTPKEAIYKNFGEALARRGYVVISTDVGQHEVYEAARTLMGERLWDLMRCVDYLVSLPEVDAKRVGCAGLSLGGEMAMWLGAMDPRISATVSAGFLTYMDQMEQNHCMCWKFDGLRELVDFPDIYSLMAPRALQCQNGKKEPKTQFTVPLAKKAMKEVSLTYKDFGVLEKAELHVHGGGHEIDLEALIHFLDMHLRR
ncbi:MAG TPA: alpha/beta hydrolase family protein [Candidatus Hydrogenedentes bacterium]|nr:alpha/beta hydrolase family protein [Candidatus Hydrogenedentota bacterium]